ncbi:MAG: hypothetical protein JNM18_21895 [Planctomycetaceae bacterium]|nr:hypothetical protein [Planctomycetaceae bacterium]
MSETIQAIAKLTREDRRYHFDAYIFIFEALRFGQERLGMGTEHRAKRKRRKVKTSEGGESERVERHLSAQELCEAARQLALDQFGFMAKTVLNNWGIHATSDFGEMVFNLIRIGECSKTDEDRREDFDNVYDFDEGLCQAFRIEMSNDR